MNDKYRRYNFKFYLNASHAIYLSGKLGQSHPHTWEIALDTIKIGDDFVQFDAIERMIESYLIFFQDKNLNQTSPFDSMNPTLETISSYFKDEIGKLLAEKGWALIRIEVAETPSRSYIIDLSDDYLSNFAPFDTTSRPSSGASERLSDEADRLLDQILD
ncbi:MAG TPA: 6-pyruvoyl tetrahydrobiopterin synthase [Clostridiaceae bacterium]|jgi:6-pyruvoyltetrahydropterin/6-carboxytetrahydropterin synthase|nr:6-pyruvoyl tetrahydrobiopterin synthase [Clostridiaceae bacterium]